MVRSRQTLVPAVSRSRGSKIEFDETTLMSVLCKQMDMDLVSTEPRAALTEFSKIERGHRMAEIAECKHRAATARIAVDEYEVTCRHLGAIEKRVNRMHVPTSGRPGPEMKGGCCQGLDRGRGHSERQSVLPRRTRCSDLSEVDDTRSHGDNP